MKIYLALIAIVVFGFVAGCSKAPDNTVVIPPSSENTQPPVVQAATPPPSATSGDVNIQTADDTLDAMDSAIDSLQ